VFAESEVGNDRRNQKEEASSNKNKPEKRMAKPFSKGGHSHSAPSRPKPQHESEHGHEQIQDQLHFQDQSVPAAERPQQFLILQEEQGHSDQRCSNDQDHYGPRQEAAKRPPIDSENDDQPGNGS